MANAQPEPSMDEILASIRRIISEDEDSQSPSRSTASRLETLTLDDDAEVQEEEESSDETSLEKAEAEEEGPQAFAEMAGFPVEESLDDFTEDAPEMDEVSVASAPDNEMASEAEEEPMVQAAVAKEEARSHQDSTVPSQMAAVGSLISESVEREVSDAFGSLEQNVRISAGSGRTMEDIVEAMLGPMVKEWLDANLPRIVEEKVEEEVRRIARRRG